MVKGVAGLACVAALLAVAPVDVAAKGCAPGKVGRIAGTHGLKGAAGGCGVGHYFKTHKAKAYGNKHH